ncbi:5-Enolpyruvylshikimate-3-phosphate synthase [hydrothermal vent metagenome]|uniref:3-phosphoshikimate 1-carboxyvinyltransferase n=1 Tax=hydrothermal vent metagenome TaxID=652676 RepID=A0A1W1ECT6_9ZZZZ
MNTLTLKPIDKIDGEVNLPGSKSLSNRALLLAAFAEGTTKITNLLKSDDTKHMLNALKQLGIKYTLNSDMTECIVVGNGGPINSEKTEELFLGNAGTAMRPLCAALSLGKGSYILTGEPRMKERPIGHLVDALRQAGASITYIENDGYPPVKIDSNGLIGGEVKIDGEISSQFLTALLLASPMAKNDMIISIKGELVSKPYIDITLHIMKSFGVDVINDNYEKFIIKGNQTYKAIETFMVEGDASSASYFLAAAAIKGGCVKVTGIGKNSVQGDVAFANVLEKMGAKVEWGDEYVSVCRGELKAIDMDFNHIPDAAMTIATTALFVKGTTTLRNIYNWRVKETDRLFAMATELRKVGAIVEEGEDYLKVTAPEKLTHASIDTYDDHRMAMCFSLLALDPASVTINEPECTSKTFPKYFDVLKSISKY